MGFPIIFRQIRRAASAEQSGAHCYLWAANTGTICTEKSSGKFLRRQARLEHVDIMAFNHCRPAPENAGKPYIIYEGLALASAIAPHGRILKAVALAGERVGWSIRQSAAFRQTSRKQISPTISACAGKHKRSLRGGRAFATRGICAGHPGRRGFPQARYVVTQNPSRVAARGAIPRGKNAGAAKA